MPDTALFIDVLAHIEIETAVDEDKSRWNQGVWGAAKVDVSTIGLTIEEADAHDIDEPVEFDARNSCGTNFCFAGWACVLKGEPIAWTINWVDNAAGVVHLDGYKLEDGTTVAVRARQLLGIDYSRLMFEGNNDLDDLYRYSAHFTGLDEAVLRDRVQTRIDQIHVEEAAAMAARRAKAGA